MKIWKGNGSTNTLLFFLKGHGILHQERRGQMNTIVMEHFRKFRPAYKQHNYQSINQSIRNDADLLVKARSVLWDKFLGIYKDRTCCPWVAAKNALS
jgi:hypothetical protein